MIIRTAAPSDAPALLAIYAPYVQNTAVSFEYAVPTEEEFRLRIENTLKDYPYLAAVEDGRIIGYAYASIYHGREAYRHCVETSIYVADGFHGRGTGKALYEAMEKILLSQNVFTLYACIAVTEREDDEFLTPASVLFHEKCGYRTVGRHENCGYKFGRWYGTVWMEKRLCPLPETPEGFIPFSML